jgi:hypothetical protein
LYRASASTRDVPVDPAVVVATEVGDVTVAIGLIGANAKGAASNGNGGGNGGIGGTSAAIGGGGGTGGGGGDGGGACGRRSKIRRGFSADPGDAADGIESTKCLIASVALDDTGGVAKGASTGVSPGGGGMEGYLSTSERSPSPPQPPLATVDAGVGRPIRPVDPAAGGAGGSDGVSSSGKDKNVIGVSDSDIAAGDTATEPGIAAVSGSGGGGGVGGGVRRSGGVGGRDCGCDCGVRRNRGGRAGGNDSVSVSGKRRNGMGSRATPWRCAMSAIS